MLSYAIIPINDSNKIESKKLFPKYYLNKLEFFIVGVRNIDVELLGYSLDRIMVSFDISGDDLK